MVATSEWDAVAEDFRLHLVSAAAAGETIRTYVAYTRLFYNWLSIRELDIFKAEKRTIATFLATIARSHTRNTVRNYTCALRAFYRFCIADGRRQDDPTGGISLRKPKLQPRRPFSPSELRALYMAPKAAPVWICDHRHATEEEALPCAVEELERRKGK